MEASNEMLATLDATEKEVAAIFAKQKEFKRSQKK